MEYIRLALSLAWPQIVVAVLWFVAALAALRYARITKRPLFLFGGIAALLLSASEILSPARLAERYFTNRVYCPSVDACTSELRFGAAKYEWLIAAMAALVFGVGLYLEIAYARRRAAAKNAARAASSALAASSAREPAPAGVFVGQHQAASAAQSVVGYGAAQPEDALPAMSESPAGAADLVLPAEDEQPPLYERPAPDTGSD